MDYANEPWINGPAGHHPDLDAFMRAAANWGEWLFVGIVVAWLAFAWLRGGSPERRGALTALVASGLSLAINQVLGIAWDRPRPFFAHPAAVHVLVAHARDGSFPSDHAAAGLPSHSRCILSTAASVRSHSWLPRS